jgi:hypothetical protein
VNRDYERRRDLLLLHADSPPPWTPAALGAALAGWWEADRVTLNGGNVASIIDKSANARNMAQAIPVRQPAYIATGAPGGGPCVRFAGGYLQTVAFALAQPYHIIVALKPEDTANVSYVVDSKNTSTSLINILWNIDDTIRMYAGTYLSGPSVLGGTPIVVDALFAGASSAIGINGAPPLTGSAGETGLNGLTLGGTGAGTALLAGDVYGVVLANRGLTASERAAAVAYFRGKAGF